MLVPMYAALRFAMATVAAFALGTGAAWAEGVDILVLGPPALKATFAEIVPVFESVSGNRLVLKFDSAAALKRSIDAGEAFDLAILSPAHIDELSAQGKIAPGSRIDVARSAEVSASLKNATTFTAAIALQARDPEAARAFLTYLMSSPVSEVLEDNGMQRAAR